MSKNEATVATTDKKKPPVDPKKAEKAAKQATLQKTITGLLLKSKVGLSAAEVGEALVKAGTKTGENLATVRRFIRTAGVTAEKDGFSFIKETMKESNKKVYNIVKAN